MSANGVSKMLDAANEIWMDFKPNIRYVYIGADENGQGHFVHDDNRNLDAYTHQEAFLIYDGIKHTYAPGICEPKKDSYVTCVRMIPLTFRCSEPVVFPFRDSYEQKRQALFEIQCAAQRLNDKAIISEYDANLIMLNCFRSKDVGNDMTERRAIETIRSYISDYFDGAWKVNLYDAELKAARKDCINVVLNILYGCKVAGIITALVDYGVTLRLVDKELSIDINVFSDEPRNNECISLEQYVRFIENGCVV